MSILCLAGCAPTPLAHYLKALGVLRLLSEQLPPDQPRPRGAWQGETFMLHSSLDRTALEQFFLNDYRPTPILAPWNGGSGFYFREKKSDQRDAVTGKKIKTGERTEPTEATRALARIESSLAPRFSVIRDSISNCRTVIGKMGLKAAPKEADKVALLLALRSRLPEAFVNAQDAAYVLLGDDLKPPPLLGTGFNDGNLDFSSNFLQLLPELFDLNSGQPQPSGAALLRGSLFGEIIRGLADRAIGQFFPHAAGGNNGTTGFKASGLVNPWDFVLMVEGSLLFGAAAVKRLQSRGPSDPAFPFVVASGNYGSISSTGAASDGGRGELWAPLWSRPALYSELRQLFTEGRVQLGTRQARDGLDFSRAITNLGIDRGVTSFQRFSFLQRNGDNHFATPLDRVPVRRRAQATALLDDLDRNGWLDRVRAAARGDRVPNSVASAVRSLEQAALALLRSSQHDTEDKEAAESLLIAVADAEAALTRSLRWSQEKHLGPAPMLSAGWWHHIRHGTEAELDLAAGLASLRQPSLRCHWEPLDLEKPLPSWDASSREVVWHDGQLEGTLIAIHERRLRLDETGRAFETGYAVRPASIAAFLDGRTEDIRLARLARALSLVQLPIDADRGHGADSGKSFWDTCSELPALFVLPRLALAGRAPDSGEAMPRIAAILLRGGAGDGTAATRLAAQRLRASGFAPAVSFVPTRGPAARRALAATLFPLSRAALEGMADSLRALNTTD